MASFDYIDALYRSRLTLMKLLTLRGYEVSAYNRFSPKEVEAMSPPSIIASAGFMVSHTSDPKKKCLVVYNMGKINSRTRVMELILQGSGMSDGETEEHENRLAELGYENVEVIVMTNDNITETHKTLAFEEWSRRKLNVSFFNIYQLINNPMEHVLVPKHERITEDEEAEVMKLVQSKAQLPVIKYHLDPIARCLGLTPGEIVKITRPSPSAGVYVVYRVCAA